MPDTSALNIPHSPIAALGTITLLIAYVVAAYAAAAGIIGNAQHRRRLVTSSVYALYGFFALMMFASALIIYAFVTHDFTIKYVTMYSDTTMPLYYKITAYWGGLDGSMMFWVSVLSAFSAIAVKTNSQRHRDMIGYVVGVIMIVQIFFLSILIYNKNPFATWLTTPPVDGKGLNPLLQTYWMTIHPPSLYIGFVSATIPFAFGIAALASGRLDDMWLGSVRSWVLICWFFLSFGLILGGRWAYEELGWGGYWAWDPVENAGLLPWFTATAFLHSVIIQEQRGMMKVWNLVLVITTFFLTIFGTFMTRSGVVQSVHAFGEDNQLALLFILFMATTLVLSFGLLVYRLPRLRSINTFDSLLSREFAFLLNNWILLGSAFFVLFATMFPTLSEAVTDHRITVGPPFFNKWMIPLGLTLMFLAGAAPLLAWRRTTRTRLSGQFIIPGAIGVITIVGLVIFLPETRVLTPIIAEVVRLPISLINFGLVAFTFACIGQEFIRGTIVRSRQTGSDPVTSLLGLVVAKRRKYGGYIIHAAIGCMFFGFAGKAYEDMKDFTVTKPGESYTLRDYVFVYDAIQVTDTDWAKRAIAPVTLLSREAVESGEQPTHFGFSLIGADALPADTAGWLTKALQQGLADVAPGPAEALSPSGITPDHAKALPREVLAEAFKSTGVEALAVIVVKPGAQTLELSGALHDTRTGKVLSQGTRTLSLTPGGVPDRTAAEFAAKLYNDAHFPGVLAYQMPERRQYKKVPDQPTTEVDIYVTMKEDVYLILTGFNADTQVANFRIYINPLINWVWLGFFMLAIGTAICLLPQAWSDKLSTPRAKRPGVTTAALILLAAGGLLFGSIRTASAQAEHQEAGGHSVGESAAHLYRPDDAGFLAPYRARAVAEIRTQQPGLAEGSRELENLTAARLAPIIALADKAMHDLVCLCGGCSRENLLECKCGLAATERSEVLEVLSQHDDLFTDAGRQKAYDDTLEHFIAKYEAKQKGDGEAVLMVPRDEGFNRLSWVVPYVALGGALALLYGFGRRWVRRGRSVVASAPTGAPSDSDEDYADILDDELRDTDE